MPKKLQTASESGVGLSGLLGGISLRDLIYLAVKDAAKELLQLRNQPPLWIEDDIDWPSLSARVNSVFSGDWFWNRAAREREHRPQPKTYGELISFGRSECFNLRNCGEKTIAELDVMFAAKGESSWLRS